MPHSVLLEWDVEDRAKLVAHRVEQASRCDMCGTAGWEWDDDQFAYHADEEFCFGCYQKSMKSEENKEALPGTRVVLLPRGAKPKEVRRPGRRRKKK